MENREELLTEIMKRVQRNYVHVVEMERLTKELGDALSRNDQESVQLLIKMRQDELEQIGETKQEIRMLVETSGDEKENLKRWLQGVTGEQPAGFEEKKIWELSSQLTQILERTISLDKAINSRVAGKDSYYQSVQ